MLENPELLPQGYTLHDNMVYYQQKFYIPDVTEVKWKLLHEAHDSHCGGHQGVSRTYAKLRRYVYWHDMRRQVEHYVKSCPNC